MKAWQVIGYTHNGEKYCEGCAIDIYAGQPDEEGDPTPIFVSDEIPSDWLCDSCDLWLAGEGKYATPCEICGAFVGVPCNCWK